MSKEDERAIKVGLINALDAIGQEVQNPNKEMVGYYTVILFKDKHGLLSSLEHHGAVDYGTSLLGFVHLSTRRLESELDSVQDVSVSESKPQPKSGNKLNS